MPLLALLSMIFFQANDAVTAPSAETTEVPFGALRRLEVCFMDFSNSKASVDTGLFIRMHEEMPSIVLTCSLGVSS